MRRNLRDDDLPFIRRSFPSFATFRFRVKKPAEKPPGGSPGDRGRAAAGARSTAASSPPQAAQPLIAVAAHARQVPRAAAPTVDVSGREAQGARIGGCGGELAESAGQGLVFAVVHRRITAGARRDRGDRPSRRGTVRPWRAAAVGRRPAGAGPARGATRGPAAGPPPPRRGPRAGRGRRRPRRPGPRTSSPTSAAAALRFSPSVRKRKGVETSRQFAPDWFSYCPASSRTTSSHSSGA